PGTGHESETGTGAGQGYTVNVPLPAGCGDGDYAASFADVLLPIADAYRPELVLVSAGFDAHRDDALAGMQVSEEGFAALCGAVKQIAEGQGLRCLPRGSLAHALQPGAQPRERREVEPTIREEREVRRVCDVREREFAFEPIPVGERQIENGQITLQFLSRRLGAPFVDGGTPEFLHLRIDRAKDRNARRTDVCSLEEEPALDLCSRFDRAREQARIGEL